MTGGGKPDIAALFYSDLPGIASEKEKQEIMDKSFTYSNPVSGAVMERNLSCMIDDYLGSYIEYLLPLEKSLIKTISGKADGTIRIGGPEWTNILSAIDSWQRKSPKNGLPFTSGGEFRFIKISSFEDIFSRNI